VIIAPPTEAQARTDLAAAFRWAARLNWHESIVNHFSVVVSEDRCKFLLNPNGRHFSRIRASELLLLDARCILHTHMPHATALCCIKGFEFLMLDQNACRYHKRIAYDRNFDGMVLNASEGARVASLLGEDKSVLMMGNHGVLVTGASVAEAFDDLYYLECAAKVQILALSTGRAPALIPDTIAAKTCAEWFSYPSDLARLHFDALKEILDEEEPSYRQ
jgi:ribulose-5-phosphate 4-epimerase/fuculose-1-phosphate aldolase